jgi:hypothetical protein
MKTLCLLLVMSCGAVAAPIPKNLESKSDAIKQLFGEVITDDAVSFDLLRKTTLSATIGKSFQKRDLTWNGRFPVLATKEFAGEFVATVKLAIDFDKEAALAEGHGKRLCCSGLIVSSHDDKNSSFIGYYHTNEANKWQSGLFTLNHYDNGGSSMTSNMTFDTKPFSIRLSRRDGKIGIETAPEGSPYASITTAKLRADAVKISLVHFNSLDAETTALFEDFTVTEAPEKK